MKKYIIAISVASLLVSGAVFAQSTTTQAERAALAVSKVLDKCQTVEARINNKVTGFKQNKVQHIDSYNKTKARISALLTKLEGEGYDVDAVRADVVTYDSMIQKFATDYASFINVLGQTQQFTCGKSAGEFKAQLAAARTQLKAIHDDNVALRTYWASTLKPEILAIKSQVKASATSGNTVGTTPTVQVTTGGQQ